MVKMAANSPTSSPVTITVTSSGGSRNIGLTSPIPRRQSTSNNPNSPLTGGENRRRSSGGGGRRLAFLKESTDEFVAYTVQIPSTPDNRILSDSQNSPPLSSSKSRGRIPNEGFIKDAIFTGGFNSVTKAHMRKSSDDVPSAVKSKLICGMEGCDEKAVGNHCECGFGICRDCYSDCVDNVGGHCPGCKDPYRDVSDGDGDDEGENPPPAEEEDRANPLPEWGRGVKLDKNLSVVQSFKNPNHDFDHNRWLFETKGTYGYGNALWPRDGYEFGRGRYETAPDFSDKRNKPLTRKVGISAAIISPYRYVSRSSYDVCEFDMECVCCSKKLFSLRIVIKIDEKDVVE